jgi:hypothetical protein
MGLVAALVIIVGNREARAIVEDSLIRERLFMSRFCLSVFQFEAFTDRIRHVSKA